MLTDAYDNSLIAVTDLLGTVQLLTGYHAAAPAGRPRQGGGHASCNTPSADSQAKINRYVVHWRSGAHHYMTQNQKYSQANWLDGILNMSGFHASCFSYSLLHVLRFCTCLELHCSATIARQALRTVNTDAHAK